VIPLTHALRTLLLAIAASLMLGAAPAGAASTQLVFFEAPRDLTATTATDASRAAAFTDFEALGVKALRVNLRWSDVALSSDLAAKPAADMTDPSNYYWGAYASVIDTAKSKGMTVLISLAGPAPKWATAVKADNLTRPSAQEFRFFAAAAAKRFGSGNVLWSVWNEPNLKDFLLPQLSGGKPISPLIYRELYIAAYAGIKTDAGLASSKVFFGETAPVGGARDGRLFPLVFFREALCLTTKFKLNKACGSKLPIDGISHHPYQFTPGKPKANDVTYQNLGRLATFLDKAAKAGAVPAGLPIYYTEFGIQSLPDEVVGVTQQAQLEMRARAERAAFYNKRVRGFSQYLLTDDTSTGGFQTGLRLAGGKAKPAYNAFKLTLDAKPVGKGKRPKTSLWGLVRVAQATPVTIEVSTGGAFKPLKSLVTNSLGAFTYTDKYRKGAKYRYTLLTPEGSQTSPFVRPFAGWMPADAKKF
jgi:Cellulase (glycosyl hydrolase family 5)